MRLLIAASLALCASQAIAHDLDGHHPVPKLTGARKFLRDFKGERIWEQGIRSAPMGQARERRHADSLRERGGIEERQNTNGRCGSRYGSCATGYCCSYDGYCGKGADYCISPDCQINYGSGCDGNQKPSGVDTSTIARPKLGKVAYGSVGIYDCVNPGDIAITFDDGPWNYTSDLLDKLAKYQAKATFFITGTNLHKGQINDPSTPWPSVIQRMAAEGHQIASHTWSHENYSQLTTTQFQNQIYWNEIAFNDILGYFPTYMRPPYSICPTNTCGSQLAAFGYHVVYFDLDTEGYLNDDPTQIQASKDIWDDTVPGTNPCRTSFLQIEHDIHYQTVYNLTDYVLTSLFNSGYRSVTVGQCLGDPSENWYRAGSKAVPSYTFTPRAATGTWSCLTQSQTSTPTGTSTGTAAPTSTLVVSTDGNCGSGITCQGSTFGNCCSVNGFCGSSINYCGTGCNAQFGSCSTGDSPLPGDDPIPSTTTSGATPTGTLQVSVDGSCGNGFTCTGSGFGNCCSEHGFCGSTDDYCLTGCQPAFGSGCQGSGSTTTDSTTTTGSSSSSSSPSSSSSSSSTTRSSTKTSTTKTSTTKTSTTKTSTTKTSTTKTSTTKTSTTKTSTTKTSTTRTSTTTTTSSPTSTAKPISTDGTCGPTNGYTCIGSGFGSCCNGLTNRCALLCLIGNCTPEYGTCLL